MEDIKTNTERLKVSEVSDVSDQSASSASTDPSSADVEASPSEQTKKKVKREPFRKTKFIYKYRKPIVGEGALREIFKSRRHTLLEEGVKPLPEEFDVRGVAEGKPHMPRPLERMRWHKITRDDEIGYFAPLTWEFWRCLIVCFCLMCLIGHGLEMPYCLFMDHFFGIVADDYAVWTDPWYHPYWVYGAGAVAMTFVIEPLKEFLIMRRQTLWGALIETFVLMVLIAMVLELLIGLMVNQPDELGVYPYWDNSQLPLNVFGQAWLVNDIFIAIGAMIYVWILYPLVNELFMFLRPSFGNALFVLVVVAFTIGCIASYSQILPNA